MSKNLWIPTTDSDGVPVEALRVIIQQLNDWRAQYLPRVGVPTDFAAEWDFVSAVSACASDATFHIMWIILFNALDDRGIRESLGSPHGTGAGVGTSPALTASNGLQQQIEELKTKVLDEALHGAMRIAGLVRLLSVAPSTSDPIPNPGGRADEEWLPSTRPSGDARLVQLRGDPPRAFRTARGAKLHRGPRAVLVFVRGGGRSGARAPTSVCARARRADRLCAHGQRRVTPAATSASASSSAGRPASTSTPFADAATTAAGAGADDAVSFAGTRRTVGHRQRNVRRRRDVLSRS
jgi:hypothetical protein